MKLRTTKELGVLIRDIRRQAGLTQAQIAGQMHATQKWISAVENGKDTAEIGQVLRLLALLQIDITMVPADGRTPAPIRGKQTVAMSRQDSRKLRQTAATRCVDARNISLPPVPVPQLPEGDIDLDLMLNDMKGNEPR